ncbi:MAG: hypothetical protein Q9217_001031 [Psora testacea]
MTPRGKQVKLQTLLQEKEIFLYDRSISISSFSTSASRFRPSDPSFTPSSPDDPPRGSPKADKLSDWQEVFRKSRDWAQQLCHRSGETVERILTLDREISVVQRGSAIAVENIKQHTGNLKPKYEETKAWADQICGDQAFILGRWRKSRDTHTSVAVGRNFAQCLRGGEKSIERADARSPHGDMTLQDFVEESDLVRANARGEESAKRFKGRVEDLEKAFKDVMSNSKDVIDDFQHSGSRSTSDIGEQASHLLEEIEVLSEKLSSDYEHISGLQEGQKAVSQASKTAHLHKQNFIPALVQTSEEVAQLLLQAIERKQKAMKTSIQYLQQISLVESRISSMHSKLATLDVDADSPEVFGLLNLVIKLASVYGIHLVEYVRRCEWTEKVLSNIDTSGGRMIQEEEVEAKRRKRWHKDADGVMEFAELGNIGMEAALSQQPSHHRQPLANREDVMTYTERLRETSGLQDALREVSEASKILFTPSKQRNRLSIAFKNGSLHETTYGRNSMTLPGDAQTLTELRSEKSKVDEKLRSAESRIRKLEDLLHRQSQVPRASGASGFGPSLAPTFERHVTTPVTNYTSALSKARDVGSRRSSMSSRRVSQNMEPEESSLAQRIVSLEAELTAQKAQSKDLEENATARQNAEENLKSQVREAIATKEDLLSNLEAQQREFDNERRLLEEDRCRLKLQVEDLEEELDRINDSNVHNNDFYALQDQLEKHKQDAYEREDALRSELTAQGARCSSLEQMSRQQSVRNTELESTISNLGIRLQDQENAQVGQQRALRSSLLHLAPGASAQEDFNTLVETLETVAERSAGQQKELQSALGKLQAENAELEVRLTSQDDEVSTLRENLGSAERTTLSVRDDLLAKETDCASLQSQLKSVVQDQDALHSELAKADADRNTLRQQLLDKQHAHERLADQLTDLQRQLNELHGQMLEKSNTLSLVQQRHADLFALSTVQAMRADEVSKRLQLQNESLRKLLEQVGFVVTKQEEGTVIQKLPKTGTSVSTTLNDPSMPMKRSISGALLTKAELEALIESDALHWAKTEDPKQAASRYDEFIFNASAVDIEAFNEAIYKRIKDVEHIARKWQREARAYRDKAHRAHSEAHERIALRSFKEGDLALFLPTRDQATKPWAAFNVGAPHYFLREQDSHKLGKRDWLIARISKVEERVVDLSKSMNGLKVPGISVDEENPYELSDGLRWYLLDAAEEKPGAPINIGTGKATVALAETDQSIKGSIGLKKSSDGNVATKTLTRSLDSRRNSTNSKKGLVAMAANSTSAPAGLEGLLHRSNSDTSSCRAADRSSLEVHDPSRPEPSRMQEIPQTDATQNDKVGTISARDW